jgi:hypothetical protein
MLSGFTRKLFVIDQDRARQPPETMQKIETFTAWIFRLLFKIRQFKGCFIGENHNLVN